MPVGRCWNTSLRSWPAVRKRNWFANCAPWKVKFGSTPDRCGWCGSNEDQFLSPGCASGRLLQVNSPPILRAAHDPGARRPGNARFIDVLAQRGVALVAVVDDEVEAEPLLTSGQPHFV